jgi:hypothetical protein
MSWTRDLRLMPEIRPNLHRLPRNFHILHWARGCEVERSLRVCRVGVSETPLEDDCIGERSYRRPSQDTRVVPFRVEIIDGIR